MPLHEIAGIRKIASFYPFHAINLDVFTEYVTCLRFALGQTFTQAMVSRCFFWIIINCPMPTINNIIRIILSHFQRPPRGGNPVVINFIDHASRFRFKNWYGPPCGNSKSAFSIRSRRRRWFCFYTNSHETVRSWIFNIQFRFACLLLSPLFLERRIS